MKTPTVMGTFMIGMLWLVAAAAHAQDCEPDGEVQFLCGPVSPEDLAPVPQSPWVIVSSMVDEGHLYLADTRDYTSTILFPTITSRPRHDTATYGACPGPVSRQFRPHGLYLRPGKTGATPCMSSATGIGKRSKSSSSIWAVRSPPSTGWDARWHRRRLP